MREPRWSPLSRFCVGGWSFTPAAPIGDDMINYRSMICAGALGLLMAGPALAKEGNNGNHYGWDKNGKGGGVVIPLPGLRWVLECRPSSSAAIFGTDAESNSATNNSVDACGLLCPWAGVAPVGSERTVSRCVLAGPITLG